MKNYIPKFENETDLCAVNPFNKSKLSPIYLILDWENDEIKVTTDYDEELKNRIKYNRVLSLKLPYNVDATKLHNFIENWNFDILKREWGPMTSPVSSKCYGYSLRFILLMDYVKYNLKFKTPIINHCKELGNRYY
jgi:hypothetical protein